ncbi:MAG: SDR family oxidoreductase [Thermoflexales bacterium]|nr:SDR family oxidoreductase [Thermoflexales bacterium]
MKDKICLVTGANRGIGKAIALGLAQRGATVIIVCRDRERGEAARQEIRSSSGNPAVHVMLADLASLASVRELAVSFQKSYQHLHVLINNAGVAKVQRTLTVDGYETTFAVNHLAPFLLTNLLSEALQASAPARIVNVSSLVHKWGKMDFDDVQGETRYDMDKAYNQSKLANVLFTNELARRLAGTGVSVNSMEPGMTATDFGREYTGFKGFMNRAWRPFMVTPEQAAETAIYLATSPEVADLSGQHFVKSRAVKSSKVSYDQDVAHRLWEVSARLTGLAGTPP